MTTWEWAWARVQEGELSPAARLLMLRLGYHGGGLTETVAVCAEYLGLSIDAAHKARSALRQAGLAHGRGRSGHPLTLRLRYGAHAVPYQPTCIRLEWAWEQVWVHYLSPTAALVLLRIAQRGYQITTTWSMLASSVGAGCRSSARVASHLLERRGILRIERPDDAGFTLSLVGAPS